MFQGPEDVGTIVKFTEDDGDFVSVDATTVQLLFRGLMPNIPTRVKINDVQVTPEPVTDFFLLPNTVPIQLEASNPFDRLKLKVTNEVQNVLIDGHPQANVSKL